MTREEAKEILTHNWTRVDNPNYSESELDEAFFMAIEALADRPTESDFISKAEVLEIYSELYWFDSDCEVVSKADVDKIYERLQSLPSADAVSRDDLIKAYEKGLQAQVVDLTESRPTKWIPVSERLPKEYAQYLVCFKTGECYVYWLEDSDWSRSVSKKEGILAWMPLPEPYKGGEEK